MSFAGLFHDAIITTIMLWTSTECWQASKRVIVTILPCLRRFQSWNAMDNVTKRERDLALAQEALQWRRQQVSHVNNVPLAVSRNTIFSLQTRQLQSHTTGANRRSPVVHQSQEAILPATVVHVKPAAENNRKSEVLLKCASLKLMDNLNDPVRKISSFRASDP